MRWSVLLDKLYVDNGGPRRPEVGEHLDAPSQALVESRSSFERPNSRLLGLDGLRAIAIGFVLLLHASMMAGFPQNALLLAIARVGGFGVTVFFVVSGFLITHLLMTEENRSGMISIRRFYLRRAFRILPAAYVYVICVAVIASIVGVSLTRGEVASSMLFVRNLTDGSTLTAHFWTLAIEEQFYLVWPVALWLCPARYRLWCTVLFCLAAPVWRQVNIGVFGATEINWSRADLRYDALLAGAAAAIVRGEGRIAAAREAMARHSGVIVAVSCVLVAVSLLIGEWGLPGWIGAASPTGQHMLLAVITLGVVDGESKGIRRVLDWPPLVVVGQLSYSLYLWQQAFLVPWRGNSTSEVTYGLAAALLAAVASYVLVERPCLRLRGRIISAGA